MDDARVGAVRVTVPARASCRPEDRFLAVACDVLFANGRLVRGNDVWLGWLGPGASVVQPPEDRAGLGAVNRALAARGVSWSFGEAVAGAATTDSGTVIVTRGLIPGDTVVVNGQYRLQAGARVDAKTEGAETATAGART